MKPNIKEGLQTGLGCLIMPAILAVFLLFGNTKGCKNIMHDEQDDPPDDPNPRTEMHNPEKEFWKDSVYVFSTKLDTVYINPHRKKK